MKEGIEEVKDEGAKGQESQSCAGVVHAMPKGEFQLRERRKAERYGRPGKMIQQGDSCYWAHIPDDPGCGITENRSDVWEDECRSGDFTFIDEHPGYAVRPLCEQKDCSRLAVCCWRSADGNLWPVCEAHCPSPLPGFEIVAVRSWDELRDGDVFPMADGRMVPVRNVNDTCREAIVDALGYVLRPYTKEQK